jgi:hypothetical protein
VSPLLPPVRIGRIEPTILVDTVIRWGPVSVLTARPIGSRILVEHADHGVTPMTFRRSEPRC